jgi:N-carbamoyl-L-amino-acid hydrolase
MPLNLSTLNALPPPEALRALDGIYEHSPWVAERALAQRPFQSLAHLQWALAQVVSQATPAEQLALIRAHPELAGKAMVAASLTAESTGEQASAGLTHCSAEEFNRLQQLNADYNAKFGWPFILAVRGPRGTGLSRGEIIATFARRLQSTPAAELHECLRNIHRIAEIRLHDKLASEPLLGHQAWDWLQDWARHSEPEYAARGELTTTYLTEAHLALAQQIAGQMRDCGFDSVQIDAVGNVVGRYEAAAICNEVDSNLLNKTAGYEPISHIKPKTLLTGSHYDTVRNAGRFDGRVGIVVPLLVVRELHHSGRRLPFALEVVAFAEEEGLRFKATFLGSSALAGSFNAAWLTQTDADGLTMLQAMQQAGLCPVDTDAASVMASIGKLQRTPADYLGFVEVHIEQGPVLHALNLPLGVVSSINASVRYVGEVVGQASHAGTTPMQLRADAACAVAELALYLEQRAVQDGDSVATMGQLEVPAGSVNVVPGRCIFSLDLRAPNDLQRNNLERDVLQKLNLVCDRRGLSCALQETMRASAAPSAAALQHYWEAAVAALGLPIHRLPSGAGHDAMKLHEVMPQAMLFVRGQNNGISHNPLESTTSHDLQLAIEAFGWLLQASKLS